MMLEESKIMNLELRLIEAITENDIEFIETMLHEDLQFIAPNGEIITKEMDIASHKAKKMKVIELHPKFEKISIIGESATVVVVYKTKGIMLGNPIEGKFRYLRVWQFIDGRMQIIAGSCIQIS